jgi:thiol:disulfide interchange protein DsbA
MQRRDFHALFLAAGSLTLPGLSHAQRQIRDGVDFRSLPRPAPVDTPAGQIEVLEFFWYGCPHCNTFEPQLEAWSKRLPRGVVLRRVPVAFRPTFEPHQRLYYTLEALGRLDLHGKVFEAIHQARQPTDNEEAILGWAQSQGLERARVQATYQSFGVVAKVRRAVLLQQAYEVEGVPSMGVAGRYYTDAELTGSMGRALQVVDDLVAALRAGRAVR